MIKWAGTPERSKFFNAAPRTAIRKPGTFPGWRGTFRRALKVCAVVSKKKSAWVPDWVWVEYQACLEEWNRTGLAEHLPLLINCAERIIKDPGCKSIWSAMERRMVTAHKRWAAQQIEVLGRVRSDLPFLCVHQFLLEVHGGMFGLTFHESVPKSERKKKALRIQMLAKKLGAELEGLKDGLGWVPEAFHRPIQPEVASTNLTMQLRDHAASLSLADTFRALSEIQRSAAAWAASVPPITQAASDNARQLYFLRRMTQFFRDRFGTPLREQVAVLTCCLFSCDVTKDDVAKLAP
jgi:hypothetical protein